jgi:hypothetical protein
VSFSYDLSTSTGHIRLLIGVSLSQLECNDPREAVDHGAHRLFYSERDFRNRRLADRYVPIRIWTTSLLRRRRRHDGRRADREGKSPILNRVRWECLGARRGKVHWVLSGDHVTRITRSRAERLRRSRYTDCDPDILVPEARERSRARPRGSAGTTLG